MCVYRAPEHVCVSFWDLSVCYVFDGQSLAASLKLAAMFCFGFTSHLSFCLDPVPALSTQQDFNTYINNVISTVCVSLCIY